MDVKTQLVFVDLEDNTITDVETMNVKDLTDNEKKTYNDKVSQE